jgi:putative two-component system response regulator
MGKSTRERLVFLVDDQESNLVLFRKSLSSEGYLIRTFADGADALACVETGVIPDLVVSDVMMPGLDGFKLCLALKAHALTRTVPVVLVTGLDDIRDKVKGLEAGADDFVTKPFHPMELKARVRSMMRIKTLADELEARNLLLTDQKVLLEELVSERTAELENLTIGIVAVLEKANALRDGDTGHHIRRVCAYAHVLACRMGLPGEQADRIRRYASLHDVGKVGIPDAILKKEGRLTQDEYRQMKQHTVYGFELLGLACADSMAGNIALSHHERFDGGGYPQGLKGDTIPVEARIVALADSYDALTTRRCYKKAFSTDKAERIIREESVGHFDPAVVDVLFGAIGTIHDVRARFADPG